MKTLREHLEAGEAFLLDGAMGTEIQKMEIRDEDWGGCQGCNEYLVLSAPALIREVHRKYYAAGSDIVETNTFGANTLGLAEFGLEARAREINCAAARLAREAAESFGDGRARYVAGSIGPGTKLASLGQITYDAVYAAWRPQLEGLAEGGVDIFMIETCQDPLHFKAVTAAACDVRRECGRDILILISVTIETNGTMLVGSDMGAVITIAAAIGADILGINCATGPEQMAPRVHELCARFPGFTMVMPNAGMPQNINGKMVYSLPPADFAARVARYIREDGVQLAGGCCGTSPEYIAALREEIMRGPKSEAARPEGREARARSEGRKNRERSAVADFCAPQSPLGGGSGGAMLASLYSAQALAQEPRPFIIGERANTNGSKRFKTLLNAEDWEGVVEVLVEQEQGGSHALDLAIAYTGRDEVKDMTAAVTLARSRVRLPFVFDSTSYDALEAALKLYGGRPIINSVNLEEGEAHAERICRLAKRHGAALVALTIDERDGMARTADKKLEVAKRIYEIAVTRSGLAPQDLIFDVLTFTLGSGDADSRKSAVETLDGIRRVKAELPGVFTVLGLSNVSFGLAAEARKVLNSVFLSEALDAGLDMAIMHAGNILPPHDIGEDVREEALALIRNTREDALFRFLKFFEGGAHGEAADAAGGAHTDALPVEKRLEQAVLRGRRAGLEALIEEALAGTGGTGDGGGGIGKLDKAISSQSNKSGSAGDDANADAEDSGRVRKSDKVIPNSSSESAQRLQPPAETPAAQKAFTLINSVLIPAMQTVGELFGAGKMQLPFVLQSAETMRQAVNLLQPFINAQETGAPAAEGAAAKHPAGNCFVLATVRGDVHDIGKNLVDIILSNNGYTVHNLGIKCEAATIIEKVRGLDADAVGLSGLLVKSTVIMKEYLEAFKAAGIRVPVLLGGAALTRRWAEEDCRAAYDGPVVYCADAFDGLRALKLLREGKLDDALAADRVRFAPRTIPLEIINEGVSLPPRSGLSSLCSTSLGESSATPLGPDGNVSRRQRMAFAKQCVEYGVTLADDISLEGLFQEINEDRLFRTRWALRTADAQNEARPHRRRLEALIIEKNLSLPRALYGYFPCRREGEHLLVFDGNAGGTPAARARFSFPEIARGGQSSGGGAPVSLLDSFAECGPGEFDLFPAQVVTLGDGAGRYARELYAQGEYREYFLLHGLAVELTETLAAHIHRRICGELQSPECAAAQSGNTPPNWRRYSFGYPACPDLAQNSQLLTLLDAGRIGVTESEIGEMLPELSTSAFLVRD